MNILFLCSPISSVNFKEDTTPLMIDEVNSRGHQAWFSTLPDLSFYGPESRIATRKIALQPEPPFYRFFDECGKSLEDFDIIHQRIDPPFDLDYYFSTLFLELVRRPLVVNHPQALRNYNEKLIILEFPDLIAPTLISSDREQILAFVREQGEAVIKPLDSCSGRGVVRLSAGHPDLPVIDRSTAQGSRAVMVQAFLEEVHLGETRLTLLNGEAIGWMKKLPQEGSFLANFDFGARGLAHDPSPEEIHIAQRLKPFMEENRLYFTAIDIIAGKISEINLTSPGLLRQTNQVMGRKLEVELEDFFEAEFRRRTLS